MVRRRQEVEVDYKRMAVFQLERSLRNSRCKKPRSNPATNRCSENLALAQLWLNYFYKAISAPNPSQEQGVGNEGKVSCVPPEHEYFREGIS